MIRDEEALNALLDMVGRFTRETLIPAEREVEETDEIPAAIQKQMREMGLFGLTVPEEYGGLGLTMEEEALTIMELTHASCVFRSLIGTTVGIGSQGIVMDGTEAQKAEFLPPLATGEKIAAFALTEPDNGSDAAGIRTRAVRDGDHFVVNGAKRYITNAPEAALFTLMARTNPDDKGAGGVTAFIVDADTPGITVGPADKKLGQRGAHTADVIFENVRVPADRIVGGPEKEGKGFKTAMKVLDKGRIHVGSVCVGLAERMLKDAVNYAIERKQFGQPIAEFQLVQGLLADCKAEIFAGRSMVLEAARKRDRGENVQTECAAVKYFCSEMCGRVADRCLQVHGGAGYMREYDIERLYREARLFRIYEGTSQIQQIVIARGLIKEARAQM